jgi:hypothetical protein
MNFESAAIEIDKSDLHDEKHGSQITSTDSGIEIVLKPFYEDARFSSRDNFESTANEIETRDLHEAKQDS